MYVMKRLHLFSLKLELCMGVSASYAYIPSMHRMQKITKEVLIHLEIEKEFQNELMLCYR